MEPKFVMKIEGRAIKLVEGLPTIEDFKALYEEFKALAKQQIVTCRFYLPVLLGVTRDGEVYCGSIFGLDVDKGMAYLTHYGLGGIVNALTKKADLIAFILATEAHAQNVKVTDYQKVVEQKGKLTIKDLPDALPGLQIIAVHPHFHQCCWIRMDEDLKTGNIMLSDSEEGSTKLHGTLSKIIPLKGPNQATDDSLEENGKSSGMLEIDDMRIKERH